jgi:hypothetical protein
MNVLPVSNVCVNRFGIPVQRADALAADRIGGHIESRSEFDGGRTIENCLQIPAGLESPDGLVEETRADSAVGFDYCRCPGRVTHG